MSSDEFLTDDNARLINVGIHGRFSDIPDDALSDLVRILNFSLDGKEKRILEVIKKLFIIQLSRKFAKDLKDAKFRIEDECNLKLKAKDALIKRRETEIRNLKAKERLAAEKGGVR